MSTAVFPTLPGIKMNVRKSAEFSTGAKESSSGKVITVAYWSYPRWNFAVEFEFLRDDANQELSQVLGFFLARQGRHDTFYLLDPDDNTVTDQQFGLGDGTTKIFQLVRTYDGFTEPIFGVLGTPVVKVNGSTTGVTVLANGKVEFSSAPTNGTTLTWTGQFYFRVRFTEDVSEFEKFSSQLWRTSSVRFRGEK